METRNPPSTHPAELILNTYCWSPWPPGNCSYRNWLITEKERVWIIQDEVVAGSHSWVYPRTTYFRMRRASCSCKVAQRQWNQPGGKCRTHFFSPCFRISNNNSQFRPGLFSFQIHHGGEYAQCAGVIFNALYLEEMSITQWFGSNCQPEIITKYLRMRTDNAHHVNL